MIAPQVETAAESPLLELALRARDHLVSLAPALEDETGIRVELSAEGVIEAAFTEDEERALDARLTWQRARGLAASAVARGASLLCGRPVTGLLREDESGPVAGVHAGPETFRAPVVINAAGAWAGLLPGDAQPPPVAPVRGQIVA